MIALFNEFYIVVLNNRNFFRALVTICEGVWNGFWYNNWTMNYIGIGIGSICLETGRNCDRIWY